MYEADLRARWRSPASLPADVQTDLRLTRRRDRTAIGTVVPAIQFSGLLYPVSALEGASAVIGHLYPTSHFLIITRGIFSKALGAAELWPSLLALLVTSPLLLLASVAGLKKQEK